MGIIGRIPSDRLVADRRRDPQLDHAAGQQSQGPVRIARRRRPQSQGDDLRLLLAVEHLRDRGLGPPGAVEGLAESPLAEALPDVLDRLGAARERLGDPRVGPVRAVDVRLQEDLRPPDLLRGPLQLLDDLSELGPLRVGQSDDVLLLHGGLLEAPSFAHEAVAFNPKV